MDRPTERSTVGAGPVDAADRLAAQVGFALEVDRLKSVLRRSLDRFAGLLLNHASAGRSWRENGVTADRVHDRNQTIAAGSPRLWDEVRRRLAGAVGWIEPGAPR